MSHFEIRISEIAHELCLTDCCELIQELNKCFAIVKIESRAEVVAQFSSDDDGRGSIKLLSVAQFRELCGSNTKLIELDVTDENSELLAEFSHKIPLADWWLGANNARRFLGFCCEFDNRIEVEAEFGPYLNIGSPFVTVGGERVTL